MEQVIVPYRGWVLAVVSTLVLLEILWSWRQERKVYNVRETFANLGIFAGFQASKFALTGYQMALLGLFYPFRLFSFPENGWVFLLTFVLVDFIYYWFHYLSHKVKFLWAFHLVHHSSPWMNLTTSYRLNWLGGLISPFFNIPLVMLGLPLNYIVLNFALLLLYQFFCHTEAIGKLGVAEKLLDTPSNHRVHHGSNPAYIDKNFGGVLIIWDRLFGTYQPEQEKVRYGITTGFVSHNPFVLVFHGFWDLLRGRMKYRG